MSSTYSGFTVICGGPLMPCAVGYLDDEVEVYTATTENLLSEDVAIWSNIDESGELLSLDEL